MLFDMEKVANKSQTKTPTKTISFNNSNNKTHVIKRFNASFMEKKKGSGVGANMGRKICAFLIPHIKIVYPYTQCLLILVYIYRQTK